MEGLVLTLLEKVGWPVASLIILWLTGRYLKPILDKWSKPTVAQVAQIVDELLTVLLAAFPDAKWDDLLARLVRQIIEKLDLNQKNATDIAQATMLKRGLSPSVPSAIKTR
jgi:hypothetical protein